MSPELQSALSVLLQALLMAALSLVTFLAQKVAAFYVEKRGQVRAEVGEMKWALLVEQTALIVKAAEQLGIKGAIENAAASKLSWALEQAQNAANSLGLEVDVNQLRVLIESAIRDGLHKGGGEG